MKPKNALYAQSGGVTAVINASAAGVIETARKHTNRIGKVYAGRDGIIGALTEDLIDTSREPASAISRLKTTPGGAFGSCRYKLKGIDENRAHYERLIEVFRAHDIGYFFYNGGNDSADTAWKISQVGEKLGYPLICVGIPKTVDNDLAITDNCPGFGSVAKYVATSIREASFDVASMSKTSTRVFVMEVMGRHAGWITAACGLAADPEGLRNRDGNFLSETGLKDAFGHSQLGGAGEIVAKLVKDRLKYKYHWALADYLQRSARHIASRVDVEQSYKLGAAAVKLALAGRNAVMPIIERVSNTPYRWRIAVAKLADIANKEKMMPRDFITEDGFHITRKCRTYLSPLIQGEAPPPYKNGLPDYVKLKNTPVPKKLPAFRL
ncbi:MAG: 6-phosphofructokinase [Betaproteobacteria bacterium]|nr:MAG: 6-phosphofructokinase [Betaproteobacteria bacterium]